MGGWSVAFPDVIIDPSLELLRFPSPEAIAPPYPPGQISQLAHIGEVSISDLAL